MRGEWIEMNIEYYKKKNELSLPMRGEWIEIMACIMVSNSVSVSPHAGRVD